MKPENRSAEIAQLLRGMTEWERAKYRYVKRTEARARHRAAKQKQANAVT